LDAAAEARDWLPGVDATQIFVERIGVFGGWRVKSHRRRFLVTIIPL
jgi:hypothetical protein